MATCASCGKTLPSFSYGAASDRCPECRNLEQQVAPGRVGTDTSAAPRPSYPISSFRPLATTALIAVNVLVFLLMVARGVSLAEPTPLQIVQWGANFGPLSLGPQPWRILTAMFIHIGIIHLLVNMWSLWVLGLPTERLVGRAGFLALYFISGLSGSIASLWWRPTRVSAGASGAIFGLLGGLIAVMYLGKLPLPKEIIRRNLKNLLFVAGLNLFYGMSSHIDNSAHIGGLIAGLAFGAILAVTMSTDDEHRAQVRVFAAIVMAAVLGGAMTYVKHVNGYVVEQYRSLQSEQ